MIASRTMERDLYEPILATLRSKWVADHGFHEYEIDCTAQQGSRHTGGRWTRPDIVLAGYNVYEFVPGKHVELSTFEVKTSDGLDITAVYEALAHRRAAHYSYVLAYVPTSERKDLKELLGRVCEDAYQHGVGFLVFDQPSDYNTWELLVTPGINRPDPANLDDFIETQTSEPFKESVRRWCERDITRSNLRGGFTCA